MHVTSEGAMANDVLRVRIMAANMKCNAGAVKCEPPYVLVATPCGSACASVEIKLPWLRAVTCRLYNIWHYRYRSHSRSRRSSVPFHIDHRCPCIYKLESASPKRLSSYPYHGVNLTDTRVQTRTAVHSQFNGKKSVSI